MPASHSPVNRSSGQQFPVALSTPASLTNAPDISSNIDCHDFSFPFQGISGGDRLHEFADHDIDPFRGLDEASVSPGGDRNTSTLMSLQGATPSSNNRAPESRSFPAESDDGSGDGNHAAGNSLDDNMSDDLGLSIKAPANGSDGGAKPKDHKSGPAPAWSELKTKAGKERKRLPLACIACRRKKIRCSGEKPACKHCLRSRIPCVYKVTTRKAAPRTDYMAMLDKRLKRMEDRIIKIVPKSEQDSGAPNVTRAVVKPALPGSTPGPGKQPPKKRDADEAFGPELDQWARAEGKAKFDSTGKPTSLQVQEEEENKLLTEGLDMLPSRELQEHLADIFFDFVYGQVYHLLHKPSYMRKLKAGQLPPVLVLSVCALSARFSNHPYFTTSPNFLRGEEWAAPAREILVKRYEWPNITVLTCMLLLGLHEFGTCQGGRSWYFGGQAIRMAIALQLHQDLEYDPQRPTEKAQLSFVDREIRRRAMWACFMMDRFSSSAVDRPIFVKEEWLKIQLPIKEKWFRLDMPGPTEDLHGGVPHKIPDGIGQLSDPKENMGVSSYMIRVVALWGRIMNYLNQGGKDADPEPLWSEKSEYARLLRQAEEFSDRLPSSLIYSAENLALHCTEKLVNQFIFLHVSIQQNVLFMNRFAISSPASDVPKEFVTRAGAGAFAAANRISDLLKDAETHFIAAPFVGYCAFLSSTVHIFGMFSGNAAVELAAKKNLSVNVKFISKMKRYWGMFHFMSENLREQYRICADAAMTGAPAHSSSNESPIFQYGDWFARYPHGVSQSDFVDPSSQKRDTGDDAVLEQKPQLRTVEEFFEQLSPSQSSEIRDTKAQNRHSHAKRRSLSGTKKGNLPTSRRGDQQSMDSAVAEGNSIEHAPPPQGHHIPRPDSFHPGSGVPRAQMSNRAPGNLNHGFSNAVPLNPSIGSITGGFGGPPHQVQGNPQAPTMQFSHEDLIAMGLSNDSGGTVPQMDRNLPYSAYHDLLDPSVLNNGGGDSMQIDWGAALGGQLRNGDGTTPDVSSAWFMPFNVEPPKLGSDYGMAMSNSGEASGDVGSRGDLNGQDPFAGVLFSPRDGEGGLGFTG